MRDLCELNINDGGLPISRPAPSEQDFNAFEAHYKVVVPETLRELLRHANGGHPELNALDGRRGQYAVDGFYSLTNNTEDLQGMWRAMRIWRPILGDHALPFAFDAGDKQFFLDLAASPPAVKLCICDEGNRVLRVAGSLEEFLGRLDRDPELI
jgi:hypothetical protein